MVTAKKLNAYNTLRKDWLSLFLSVIEQEEVWYADTTLLA
jgi:hypothetical protein